MRERKKARNAQRGLKMNHNIDATNTMRNARDLLLSLREDLDQARAQFSWPDIGHFNWAIDWFDAELATGLRADQVALKIIGENAATRTFAQLSESSNRVANSLRALGLTRGGRILLMLDNCVPLWETMLGAMKLGGLTVPTTTLATTEDVQYRICRSGATFIITTGELAAKLGDLPNHVVRIATDSPPPGWINFSTLLDGDAHFAVDGPTSVDDPILLYFTSGTTAQPKLVLHTHRSYGIGALSTMYWLGLRPGDLHLNVSSPGWAKHAWSCFFAPWNAGATVFIANQGRFNARVLLDTLVAEKVTSICAPPTVWRMIIQEDIASFPVALTNACGAGEPLNPEVIEAIHRTWGLTIRDGFGQTETTAQIGNSPGQPVRIGSVGRPLPGYDITLLDSDGNETNEGEIAIDLKRRPAGLMVGYLGQDGALNPVGGEYYRTGDVASRDKDGWYTYVGRADDVFKSSDYRISPFELESALIEHDAIIEAAVVPAPDATRLAVPKAFISLAEGILASQETALAIFRHIASAVAPYKRIRRIEFIDLPKTISGKIRRVELRRLEIERALAGEPVEGEYRWEDFDNLRSSS
ncbi:MAG: AMP-binding protein [Novosphingobium sp.]